MKARQLLFQIETSASGAQAKSFLVLFFKKEPLPCVVWRAFAEASPYDYVEAWR
jgi:hypothetical protein